MTGNEELELGVERGAGAQPRDRDIPEGFHPWSPSALNEWTDTEQDYYLLCGCWSGQADHTCGDRRPCCGADYDCVCDG